jgi:hypothetical protein
MLQGDNPYFKEHRLPDIINAIQVMGAAPSYTRPIENWCSAMGAEPKSCNEWAEVFGDHPEFFGESDDKKEGKKTHHWLRLRRARALDQRNPGDNKTDSHHVNRPLEASEIEALVKIAIDLHARSGELFIRQRWLIIPALGFAGAIAAEIVGALFD